MYYLAFPTDPKRNKVFVYSVFILEVTQTIIATRSAFHVFGEGYGNLAFFYGVQLSWFSVPILTGISRHYIQNYHRMSTYETHEVAFIAQNFYAYRISILSQSRWVAGIITGVCMLLTGHSPFHRIYLPFSSLFFNSADRLHQLPFSTILIHRASFLGSTFTLPLWYVLPPECHTAKAQRYSGD